MGCCASNQQVLVSQSKPVLYSKSGVQNITHGSKLNESQINIPKKVDQVKSQNKQKKNQIESYILNQNPQTVTQQSVTQEKFAENLFLIIFKYPQFQKLLNLEFYQQYLRFFMYQYFSPAQLQKTIQVLIDYMRFSLSCQDPKIKNQTSYTLENFTDKFGNNAQQILNIAFMRNLNVLNNLKYLKTFQKKKFNLKDYKQVSQTAHQVRSLCTNDSTALAYLSGYFFICCDKLQKQKNPKVSIQQINSLLKQQAKKIKQVFSVTEKSKQESQFFGGSFGANVNDGADQIKALKQDYKMKQFKFKTNKKQQEIDDFIMEMVAMAKKHANTFKQITKPFCDKNQGYGYKSNLKLSQKSQTMPLLRVKQKLLGEKVKEHYKDKKYPDVKTIDELKKAEIEYLKLVLQKVYQQLDKVPFIVTDILRGKCMFNDIKDIKKSIEDIKNKVQQRKNKRQPIQVVEIRNRLKGITKDVMLLIKIQDIVCEFQLVLKFNQVQNDIHHKMYEIERSVTFTPIYVLHQWHMRTCESFFQISTKIMKEKEKLEDPNMKEQIQSLRKLKNMFKLNKKLKQQDNQPVSKNQITLLNQIMEKVKKVPQSNNQIQKLSYFRASNIFKCWGNYNQAIIFHNQHERIYGQSLISIKNEAQIYQACGKYLESVKAYTKYFQNLKKVNQQNQDYQSPLKMCYNLVKLCKNDDALTLIKEIIKYQKDKNLKSIANSHIFMGNFYLNLGKDKDALDSFQQAENLLNKNNQRQTQTYVEAISKLGYTKALLGNYKSAFDFLTKAYNVAANLFGSYSIPIAKIYSLTGKVYSQMGRYDQALQNLYKATLMYENILNTQSIQYLEELLDLIKVSLQAKQFQGILNGLVQANQLIEQLCGDESITYVKACILSSIYLRQVEHNYDKQIKTLESAIQKVRKFKLPDQNPIILELVWQMGQAFAYKKQFQKAEVYFNGAQKILTKMYGEDCLKATQLRIRVANFEGWRNDFKKGIGLLNRNIKYFQQRKLTNNINYSNNLLQLAYQQNNINLYEQSNKNYSKTQQIIKLLAGTESSHLAVLYWNWGFGLSKQEKYGQAIIKYKLSIQIYQKNKDYVILQLVKIACGLLQNKEYDKYRKLFIEKQFHLLNNQQNGISENQQEEYSPYGHNQNSDDDYDDEGDDNDDEEYD